MKQWWIRNRDDIKFVFGLFLFVSIMVAPMVYGCIK